MKLTAPQKTVIAKMTPGKWYSPYDLQCSIKTLAALQKRGIVEAHPGNGGLGSFYSPRTENQWRYKGEVTP